MWHCVSPRAANRFESTSELLASQLAGLDAVSSLVSYFCLGGHLQKLQKLKKYMGALCNSGNLAPAAEHMFAAWLEVYRFSIG